MEMPVPDFACEGSQVPTDIPEAVMVLKQKSEQDEGGGETELSLAFLPGGLRVAQAPRQGIAGALDFVDVVLFVDVVDEGRESFRDFVKRDPALLF
jgi:hypothetical protein